MNTKRFVKVLGYVAAFVVGLTVMFWICRCQRQPAEVVTVTDTLTKTVHDTTHLVKTIYKPTPVMVKVDSVAVYAAIKAKTPQELDDLFLSYYAERYYDTTLCNDTSIYARMQAMVWRNELQIQRLDLINRRPIRTEQVINQTVVNNCRTRFYLGFDLNYTFGAKVPITLGGGFLIVSKGIWAGGTSYDPFNKTIGVRNYFRLGK